MIKQLFYIYDNFFIGCDLYILIGYDPNTYNLRCIKIRFQN